MAKIEKEMNEDCCDQEIDNGWDWGKILGSWNSISIEMQEQQVENLKKIAREKAYHEDRDISYLDLIQDAIDDYILKYACAAVDKKSPLLPEMRHAIGIIEDQEENIGEEDFIGILNDVVSKKDVGDILDFLHASQYYSVHPENIDKIGEERDITENLPVLEGGKTLRETIEGEEASGFQQKLGILYQRAYASDLKNKMQKLSYTLQDLRCKYSPDLSLNDLIGVAKDALGEYIEIRDNGENTDGDLNKILIDRLVKAGLSDQVDKLIEKERAQFKGAQKWQAFKEGQEVEQHEVKGVLEDIMDAGSQVSEEIPPSVTCQQEVLIEEEKADS